MTDVLRTPEPRFDGLHWDQAWCTTADGLRVAVHDDGPRDAPVVLLLHGEPTWSYLWRSVLPPLLDAGFRVVAPDLVGFGRSDKPVDEAAHTYAGHVEWLRSALFDDLGLGRVALLCQDWGGLLGLRLLAGDPERFTAVAAANTGLPDGSTAMGEVWQQFAAFVRATPDLPVGQLVTLGCADGLAPGVVAAYDAPFPDASSKAGPRALPFLVPQSPDAPGAADNRAAWEVLERYEAPFLCAFSDGDPITAGADRAFLARVPGTRGQPHETITGGGHFLQEDRGAELGGVVARWLRHQHS